MPHLPNDLQLAEICSDSSVRYASNIGTVSSVHFGGTPRNTSFTNSLAGESMPCARRPAATTRRHSRCTQSSCLSDSLVKLSLANE